MRLDLAARPLPLVEDDVALRVEREQVRSLYRVALGATLVDEAFAWLLSLLLWWLTGRSSVFVWTALHLAQNLRYPVLADHRRDPQADARCGHWARVHAREHLLYSVIWGLLPWFALSESDLRATAIVMLSILGLCSAGVPAVAARRASTLAFCVPMVVGLALALARFGGALHLALAAFCLLHLGATLMFARQQHRLIAEALRARFDNELLAERLAVQVELARQASEDKTRFLAAASHDLRQPMHAMALLGATLVRELQAQPAQQTAQHLQRAIDSMAGSLDAMLDVSRLDAGTVPVERRAVALAPAFKDLQETFIGRAEALGLELRVRTSPLAVDTDPALLRRMLSNLVDNALKHTPAGGVLVSARGRSDRVWIEVRDTGVGIAPAQQALVFEPFYQVGNHGRDRSRGLGLGLAIVRRLAVLLDHPLTLASRPGRGTLLRLELPRVSSPALVGAVAEPSPGAPAEAPLPPLRVLLLDDDAGIGLATRALMASHGLALTVAADERAATQAVETAAAEGNPFDVLIHDHRLAEDADGLAAGLRLRQRQPGLALLLVTGETSPARLRRVESTGVPVLHKPVSEARLLQALRGVAERRGR